MSSCKQTTTRRRSATILSVRGCGIVMYRDRSGPSGDGRQYTTVNIHYLDLLLWSMCSPWARVPQNFAHQYHTVQYTVVHVRSRIGYCTWQTSHN